MFHLGADAGLGVLQSLQDSTHQLGFVQRFALARHHGNVLVHLRVLGLDVVSLVQTFPRCTGYQYCHDGCMPCPTGLSTPLAFSAYLTVHDVDAGHVFGYWAVHPVADVDDRFRRETVLEEQGTAGARSHVHPLARAR